MGVILTVTLNAAVDVTYRVDALTPHASHRVHEVSTRAGGKGVNVARVLHALGHDVVATGFAGAAAGDLVRDDLAAAGIREAFVAIDGPTRRTVTVVDGPARSALPSSTAEARSGIRPLGQGPALPSLGRAERPAGVDSDATVFNEPGPQVSAGEWARFVADYESLLASARAVALSGSLPPGVPADAYRTLSEAAVARGVPVVLDASGDALLRGVAGRPDVVKPNADELAAVAPGDLAAGARELRRRGAGAVVVSRGANGLSAVTEDGSWHVRPPERVSGNPTGAGDAVVAALAAGLADHSPLPESLVDAAALGAAAVLAPVAGDIDAVAYRRFRSLCSVEAEETACR